MPRKDTRLGKSGVNLRDMSLFYAHGYHGKILYTF